MYYALVRDFRYIMDFNPEKIFANTPHWGLPDAEVRQVIASAVGSPRGTNVPTAVLQAVEQAKSAGDEDEIETDETDTNPLPSSLPPFFKAIARKFPQRPKVAVLASLPALGTLLTRLRSRYIDRQVQCPIFFVVVQAPQASGKSFARSLSELLTAPIAENDKEERRKENEYQERLKYAKNAQEQPKDPRAVVRCLTPTVSNAVLLKRADYADGLGLYTFAEEIDTITRSNKSGTWAQKNDIYRMAFDGADWGQDYISLNSYSGVVKLRYNLLFLGTPLAVNTFFSKVEDGMASRFVITQLPENRGEMLAPPPLQSKATTQMVDDTIRRAYEEGSGDEDIYCSLPLTIEALQAWQEERIKEYEANPDNFAVDILRRRAAVIGFRAAMVCWWVCGRSEDKAVVDFAVWVANEVLKEQIVAFGDAINEVEAKSANIVREHRINERRSRNTDLLAQMQETFTKGDLIAYRKRQGVTTNCNYILTRWVKQGKVKYNNVNRIFEKL